MDATMFERFNLPGAVLHCSSFLEKTQH